MYLVLRRECICIRVYVCCLVYYYIEWNDLDLIILKLL